MERRANIGKLAGVCANGSFGQTYPRPLTAGAPRSATCTGRQSCCVRVPAAVAVGRQLDAEKHVTIAQLNKFWKLSLQSHWIVFNTRPSYPRYIMKTFVLCSYFATRCHCNEAFNERTYFRYNWGSFEHHYGSDSVSRSSTCCHAIVSCCFYLANKGRQAEEIPQARRCHGDTCQQGDRVRLRRGGTWSRIGSCCWTQCELRFICTTDWSRTSTLSYFVRSIFSSCLLSLFSLGNTGEGDEVMRAGLKQYNVSWLINTLHATPYH